MGRYKALPAFKKAYGLEMKIFDLSKTFPAEENFH